MPQELWIGLAVLLGAALAVYLLRRAPGALGSRKVEVLPDRVWISAGAKYAGLRSEVEMRSRSGSVLIALVAHFPDVLARLEAIAEEYRGGGAVRAILADRLSADAARALPLDESAVLDLLVAERHPLPAADAALARFAAALPCRCRITHHLSLEDPLLERFGAERIRGLISALSGGEQEYISHDLVSGSIRRAQQKVAAEAGGNAPAASAAEWFAKNAPRE